MISNLKKISFSTIIPIIIILKLLSLGILIPIISMVIFGAILAYYVCFIAKKNQTHCKKRDFVRVSGNYITGHPHYFVIIRHF